MIHLNTYVMGRYTYVYTHSAGIDFRRQNLVPTDVRSIPAL